MVCHARARVFLAELLSLNGSGAFNNLGWTTGFVWAGDTPAAGYHYTVVLPQGYTGTMSDNNFVNVTCVRKCFCHGLQVMGRAACIELCPTV